MKKFNKKNAAGKRFLNFLITEANRKKLNAYLKNRLNDRMRKRAFEDRAANLKDVVGTSVQHITPITQPLMLILGLRLAGGDLLSQLFDGHPQLHVHPGEIPLEIDEQKKSTNPNLDPITNPKKWFALLVQDSIDEHLEELFKQLDTVDSSLPFVFIPYLQKRIFLQYLKSMNSRDLRTVYDAYMTSYFGSWLNYTNLTGHDKKYIAGLSKKDAMHPERVNQFIEVYPDGKIVSAIRDPRNWIRTTSAHHRSNYPDAQSAINHWRESTSAVLRNKDVFGSRLCIVRYEDLKGNTEVVMRHLCKFLNIKFDSILLAPTFNSFKVRAINDAEMAEDTHKNPLRESGARQIEAIDINWNQTLNDYEAVLSKTVQF